MPKFMKKTRENHSPQRGGFTLIEIMVVLLILTMIVGLAVVQIGGQREKAKRQVAYTYVKTLEDAVEAYANDVGYPPTPEQGLRALIDRPDIENSGDWAGPYIKSTATSKDPWQNEYQYVRPGRDGRSFDVWSYGPDGIDGTDDDIGSWLSAPN